MIIYSNKIIRFVQEIKKTVKEILSREIDLKVFGDRFYDRRQEASYPIKVVIYNNKNMLGYFDAHFYELGFHESLMRTGKVQLHQVIRHELAHYMTLISHGASVQPHGKEFKEFCKQMGWGKEVFSATACLEGENYPISQIEENSIFRRIQKLMALANSTNSHEAEQAMIKSQQLLLKHNIDANSLESSEDEKMFLKRIMKQKKETAKMRSIAKILETFFVSTVYNRAGEYIYLEILGSAVNIEIADYVAEVLHAELDRLWDLAKRQAEIKGTIAKNSFFLGLAKGYCHKIQALKSDYHSHIQHSLMMIEKKLIDAKAMAYPRLSSKRSHARYCPESSALGEQMGRQLNIQPAIKRSSAESRQLIGG